MSSPRLMDFAFDYFLLWYFCLRFECHNTRVYLPSVYLPSIVTLPWPLDLLFSFLILFVPSRHSIFIFLLFPSSRFLCFLFLLASILLFLGWGGRWATDLIYEYVVLRCACYVVCLPLVYPGHYFSSGYAYTSECSEPAVITRPLDYVNLDKGTNNIPRTVMFDIIILSRRTGNICLLLRTRSTTDWSSRISTINRNSSVYTPYCSTLATCHARPGNPPDGIFWKVTKIGVSLAESLLLLRTGIPLKQATVFCFSYSHPRD